MSLISMSASKRSMCIKRVKVPLYDVTVIVILDCSVNDANVYLKKHYPQIGPLEGDELGGVNDDDCGAFFIYLGNSRDVNVFFHEIRHLTDRIMEVVGIPQSEDTAEAAAYLQGKLGELIVPLLK